MALEPRQLRAFLAIVQTGSLGRAADTLHLTQPALSRLVKQMERQLRVQLFERRTTGMELTSFGDALLPYAEHLVEEADLAIEESISAWAWGAAPFVSARRQAPRS